MPQRSALAGAITKSSIWPSRSKKWPVSSSPAIRLSRRSRDSPSASSKLRARYCTDLAWLDLEIMSDIVICLFSGSGYDRAAQGVVGAGRRLADQLKGNLHAVVAGAHNPELNIRVASVADAVITADQRELARYQP